MIVNATIERFRSALKNDPDKAATVLALYGVNTQPLEHSDDEHERQAALKTMINELTRAELLAILTYAINLKNQDKPTNITPIHQS